MQETVRRLAEEILPYMPYALVLGLALVLSGVAGIMRERAKR